MTNATVLQDEWRERKKPTIKPETEQQKEAQHKQKFKYHYEMNNEFKKPDGNETP
jgi:hypothetical protein